MVKWCHMSVYERGTGGCKTGSGEGWGVGGKIKWRLSEVNVSRGQDKLVGKFKMAAGDVISTRVSQ